jgi:hypothetical protein
MKMARLLVLCVLAAGCKTVDIPKYYESQTDEKYGPAEDPMLFFYSYEDINEMYRLLFSDYRIIGKSSYRYTNYTRGLFDRRVLKKFAKSVGADIIITSHREMASDADSHRAVLERLFLKNVNGVKPIWEMGKEDFPLLEQDEVYQGHYIGNGNVVELFRSGERILGFAVNEIAGRKGRLIFSFDAGSGSGFYMGHDENGIINEIDPYDFRINALGYLESSGDNFHFLLLRKVDFNGTLREVLDNDE